MPFRSVIRLGSQTELGDEISSGGNRIELNTVDACANSANKELMKQCFTEAGVTTPAWVSGKSSDNSSPSNLGFPIVAKHIFGSRNTGNTLLQSEEELSRWLKGKDLRYYIFEKFHNYNREYRLHVTKDGCFYTCRKLLREETPETERWYRNDSNSNWVVEDNPLFDKPVNWSKIEADCVKALKSCGLDFGACDVRVQSSKTSKGKLREDPAFAIIEINSAPSFGEITAQKYLEIIPFLLQNKYNTYVKNRG